MMETIKTESMVVDYFLDPIPRQLVPCYGHYFFRIVSCSGFFRTSSIVAN